MIESHGIKERACVFHLKDEKEMEREEREKQEESEEGKEGRDRHREGEKVLSLKGLVIPAPPLPTQPWQVTCPL